MAQYNVEESSNREQKRKTRVAARQRRSTLLVGLFILSVVFWLVAFVITGILHMIWMTKVSLTLLVIAAIVMTAHILITLVMSTVLSQYAKTKGSTKKEEH